MLAKVTLSLGWTSKLISVDSTSWDGAVPVISFCLVWFKAETEIPSLKMHYFYLSLQDPIYQFAEIYISTWQTANKISSEIEFIIFSSENKISSGYNNTKIYVRSPSLIIYGYAKKNNYLIISIKLEMLKSKTNKNIYMYIFDQE